MFEGKCKSHLCSLTLVQLKLKVTTQGFYFFVFYYLFFPCMSWGSFDNVCDSKVIHLITAFTLGDGKLIKMSKLGGGMMN